MLTLPRMQPRRLTTRLAIALILLGFMVTFISTAVVAVINYRHEVRQIDVRMHEIQLGYIDSIADQLWAFDTSLLRTQLRSITQLPDFVFAEIRVDGKTFMAEGKSGPRGGITRTFTLQHSRHQNPLVAFLVNQYFFQQIVNLVFGAADFNQGIDQSGGPDN